MYANKNGMERKEKNKNKQMIVNDKAKMKTFEQNEKIQQIQLGVEVLVGLLVLEHLLKYLQNLLLLDRQNEALTRWHDYRVYSRISIGYFLSHPTSGNFRGPHFGGFPGTYGHVDKGFEQISASRV